MCIQLECHMQTFGVALDENNMFETKGRDFLILYATGFAPCTKSCWVEFTKRGPFLYNDAPCVKGSK